MGSNWISVEDRLPEKVFRNYLVAYECNTISCVRLIKDSSNEPHYFDTLGDVTHWMPLPEPPKENK